MKGVVVNAQAIMNQSGWFVDAFAPAFADCVRNDVNSWLINVLSLQDVYEDK